MATRTSPDFSLWKMNHTMIRVKDPTKSISFYEKLGLVLIDKLPQPDFKFDLYFIGYDNKGQSPSAGNLRSDRQGLLELTHNYGTENDDNYTVSNGNEEPCLGFQHFGVAVDNLTAACERLDGLGISCHNRPGSSISNDTSGSASSSAIVRDPDGYYVEVHAAKTNHASTDITNYIFHSTGLRIKDPRISLPWYTDVLGMKLFLQQERDNITSYWLGYPKGVSGESLLEREGVVKLIWIHGSELKEGSVYHNGNNQPQGFGHLALAVDDIVAACDWFEAREVNWKKRLTDGEMKSIAFILDPDEYWIEIIQNARIKEPLGIQ